MRERVSYNFSSLWELPPQIGCDRSGDAWGIDNGILKFFPENTPRLCRPLGFCVELASENLILHSRNQTEADYVPTNLATELTQTGIDAAAATATLITPSAPAATLYQAVIIPTAGRYTFSCFLKAKTEGAVLIGMLGVDMRGVVPDTVSFNRFYVTFDIASPDSYFFGVETDNAIITDQWQVEAGEGSTPIVTTGTTGLRKADIPYWDFVPSDIVPPGYADNYWFNKNEGTFIVSVATNNLINYCTVLHLQDRDNASAQYLAIKLSRDADNTYMNAGINGLTTYSNVDSELGETIRTLEFIAVFAYRQGEQTAAFNYQKPTAPATLPDMTFDLSTANRMYIGCERDTQQLNGYMRDLTYYSKYMELSDAMQDISVSTP